MLCQASQSCAQPFVFKRHDTRKSLRCLFRRKSNDEPYPFGGYNSIKFLMRNEATGQLVTLAGTAVVESPSDGGILRYDWAAADVASIGRFTGEFEVEWADGKQSFPSENEFIKIIIVEDLDDN